MSKLELQDFVYFGKLFETYGKLLSKDRQSIMAEYFECNMTLVEIAQHRQISRQAVLDAINKSCKKLQEYETCIKLCEKRESFQNKLQQILTLEDCGDIKQKVEDILKES